MTSSNGRAPRGITIDGVDVGEATDCYVIAEIGHNHQGKLEQAFQLFAEAHAAGASAVKLQKRSNRTLYTSSLYDKPYENDNSFGRTYGEHREALEFDAAEYRELKAYAREIGITFFATAFDFESVDFLENLDMPAYKVASGDLKNTPLLRYVAETKKPMIFSTGGGTIDDVRRAYETVAELNPHVAMLQCTAGYPPDWEELDLRVIETYREYFPHAVVGYSGHDNGIAMAVAAFVLGARIVEKHFTLNRAMRGTDHRFSLEPQGLRKLVRDLQRTRRRPRRRHEEAVRERGRAGHEDEQEDRRGHRSRSRPRASPQGSRAEVPWGRPSTQPARARARPQAAARTARRRRPRSPAPGAAHDRDRDLRRRGIRGRGRRMTDGFSLSGRVAIVTGALGRLGPIWTQALTTAGAAVVGVDVAPPGPGATVRIEQADVCDKDALQAVRERIEREVGVPTILVNNAGIDVPPGSANVTHRIEDVPLEDFRTTVDVNLAGTFVATQVFGPAMRDAGHGSIVNIGSLYASIAPEPTFYDHFDLDPPFLKPAAYGASKAGVLSLTRYFARLWGPHGVRVNALSPGGVSGGQDPEFLRKFCARVPLRRMAEPSDLGGPLVFLASDASSYLTGHELRLDGGFTA